MPATMMHLAAGKALCPNASDAFYLGCILPDCVDSNRTLKDHLHFRDIDPALRLPSLVSFGKGLQLSRPFDFGALYHFYLDYLWDNGPQSAHRRAYTGESWFLDYRKELSAAGSRCAQRAPWNDELWARLRSPAKELYENPLALPEDDIHAFLEFNAKWHTETRLPESEVFTDEVVEAFLKRAERAFLAFLGDFFPAALALWSERDDGIKKLGE